MYEALYAQNKGLLIAMARRYAGACALDRAVSVEDLVQSGFLGLVRAAQTYDRNGGRSWTSWATWHIQRTFEQALYLRQGHRTQAHSGADTLDRPLDTANEAGETAGDLLVDETLPDPDSPGSGRVFLLYFSCKLSGLRVPSQIDRGVLILMVVSANGTRYNKRVGMQRWAGRPLLRTAGLKTIGGKTWRIISRKAVSAVTTASWNVPQEPSIFKTASTRSIRKSASSAAPVWTGATWI